MEKTVDFYMKILNKVSQLLGEVDGDLDEVNDSL